MAPEEVQNAVELANQLYDEGYWIDDETPGSLRKQGAWWDDQKMVPLEVWCIFKGIRLGFGIKAEQELKDAGKFVPIPQSIEQAKAMNAVSERYLKGWSDHAGN